MRDITTVKGKLELLAEDYGVETIIEQNDIDPTEVLKLMFGAGLFDLNDYFYRDGALIDEQDEEA